MKNVGHYDWLAKKNCQLMLSTMARTFVGVGDVSFRYKSFPLYFGFFKVLFKANLSLQIFQLTERFGV